MTVEMVLACLMIIGCITVICFLVKTLSLVRRTILSLFRKKQKYSIKEEQKSEYNYGKDELSKSSLKIEKRLKKYNSEQNLKQEFKKDAGKPKSTEKENESTSILVKQDTKKQEVQTCQEYDWSNKSTYEKCTYFKSTRIPYEELIVDKGKIGEYKIYRALQHLEPQGCRFLFNVYLPTAKGTTEIDVIMLTNKGIFCFESKNFSGWIYGSENDLNWTQTLVNYGEISKYSFFNPVKQNEIHIRNLRYSFSLSNRYPIWSIIVFSNDCVLKSITLQSEDIHVIQEKHLVSVVTTLLKKVQRYLMKTNFIIYIICCTHFLSQVNV